MRLPLLLAVALLARPAVAADKPLKVFILAGQSNMQGHASVSTFDSLAVDPKTAPLLKQMRGPDGKPRVCEKVWITSVGCQGNAYDDLKEVKGKLTAGFGAPDKKIGPEFTFGITMEERLKEPVLLIKTSWGGRSLHKDTLFERSCRTPMIVRDPAAKGNGKGAGTITEFVDLYPTLAARCGLNGVPKNLEGADFRKVLDDASAKHKEAAVTVVRRGKLLGRSIRTDRHRYTEWDGGEKGAELYDHTTDPGEWKNLAADPKATDARADLKKRLDAICPTSSGQ